jgi:thiamine phosphate synthase YjbQ (UPF0047 family)
MLLKMLRSGCDDVAMLHQSYITAEVNGRIAVSCLVTGIAVISCLHTSCSLIVNENADPRVLADLSDYLRDLVPSLSFVQSRLLLGLWQAIYLWEHRAAPHRRTLHLHLIGQ